MSLSSFLDPVNINSHGKKGFAGVIKLMLLRWEIILVYLGRHNKGP